MGSTYVDNILLKFNKCVSFQVKTGELSDHDLISSLNVANTKPCVRRRVKNVSHSRAVATMVAKFKIMNATVGKFLLIYNISHFLFHLSNHSLLAFLKP